LAESLVTEKIAQCSVDYVHPLGLNELQISLTQAARDAVKNEPWGIAIDSGDDRRGPAAGRSQGGVSGRLERRAEKDRVISQEKSRAEQRLAAAEAVARQTRDRAESSAWRGSNRVAAPPIVFCASSAQFQSEAESGGQTAEEVRRGTMRRLLANALDELLPKLAGKGLLDPTKPVDLTIFPPAEERRGGKGEERK